MPVLLLSARNSVFPSLSKGDDRMTVKEAIERPEPLPITSAPGWDGRKDRDVTADIKLGLADPILPSPRSPTAVAIWRALDRLKLNPLGRVPGWAEVISR